jgi:hypothetical protein
VAFLRVATEQLIVRLFRIVQKRTMLAVTRRRRIHEAHEGTKLTKDSQDSLGFLIAIIVVFVPSWSS